MSTRVQAPVESRLSPTQVEFLRRVLLEEHAAQQARSVELQDPVDLEPDLAELLLVRCRETLDEIEAALSLISHGHYGACTQCGAAIPYERLEAVPATQRCVSCQARLDRVLR
jgi:RNA polymerase-binding transcription factor DksA